LKEQEGQGAPTEILLKKSETSTKKGRNKTKQYNKVARTELGN
jgi:hypothetical protein